jgi:hypothetical protein
MAPDAISDVARVDEPVPVLAVTILDDATLVNGIIVPATKLLVVVRDPRANATHPDVVSVPTQRIPFALAGALLESSNPLDREVTEEGETVYFAARESNNLQGMSHDPLLYAVIALMTRKLGVTEQLEWSSGAPPSLVFHATLSSITVGFAKYINMPPGQQLEYIKMFNAGVRVLRGSRVFPQQTSSYSLIKWVEVDHFMEAMRDKNPMAIDSRLRLEQYCIHGLCVHAAHGSLARALRLA